MKKVNNGKRFEKNFRDSIPEDLFCYRFKDGTANFRGAKNENVRFQSYNICDFMVFNGKNLFLLELKAHKGKSLPLNCIRETQLKELIKASLFPNVKAGLLVYFTDLGKVFYLSIDEIVRFKAIEKERKSIPFSFFCENALNIPNTPKEVNIVLNLNKLFKN